MKTGIELIAQERQEQIDKHGRTIERDVRENSMGELSDAASILCLYDWGCNGDLDMVERMPEHWNRKICLKMLNKTYRERLIIAGALIAAELDRLNKCNA